MVIRTAMIFIRDAAFNLRQSAIICGQTSAVCGFRSTEECALPHKMSVAGIRIGSERYGPEEDGRSADYRRLTQICRHETGVGSFIRISVIKSIRWPIGFAWAKEACSRITEGSAGASVLRTAYRLRLSGRGGVVAAASRRSDLSIDGMPLRNFRLLLPLGPEPIVDCLHVGFLVLRQFARNANQFQHGKFFDEWR